MSFSGDDSIKIMIPVRPVNMVLVFFQIDMDHPEKIQELNVYLTISSPNDINLSVNGGKMINKMVEINIKISIR